MAIGEKSVNQVLGNILRKTNHEWQNDYSVIVEETGHLSEKNNLCPDILIADPSMPPVIIETSFTPNDADKDAKARLGKTHQVDDSVVETVIAIELDSRFKKIKPAANDEFRYALYQTMGNSTQRFPEKGFLTGSMKNIARLAASTSIPRDQMLTLAKKVGDKITASANILATLTTEKKLDKLTKGIYQRTHITGLNTTALLWLNALQVQKTLSITQDEIPPPSSTPSKCLENWRIINSINWKAIFEPSINILDKLIKYDAAKISTCIKKLIEAVEMIEMAKLGSEKNIGAEIFPLLSDDRETSAAYYTQSAPAEFLCNLVIKDDYPVDWSDPKLFEQFKIADLACGTGTLLRYAYKLVRTLHNESGGNDSTCSALHQSAMSKGLYGTDVSPIAAHLTSSSLAVASGQKYGMTNIGWVAVGNKDRTGSIEYIVNDTIMDLFGEGGGSADGSGVREHPVTVADNTFDVILMNPPYTRTRKGLSAFDIAGLSQKERTLCQEQWGKQIRHHACTKTAGMAATFVCIALKKLKPGGRMGFILPRSAATTDAWKITRSMIEQEFEDITAVVVASGKALGKTAASADTLMEEMYLVATKKQPASKSKPHTHSPVRNVTLHEAVLLNGIAAEKARAISEGPDDGTIVLGDGGTELGISRLMETNDGSSWNTLDVKSDMLASYIKEVNEGMIHINNKVIDVEMTTLDELFTVGDTHDLIGHPRGKDPRGCFTFDKIRDELDAVGKYRSLWKTESKKQNKLVVLPTHKGTKYLTDKIYNEKRKASRKSNSKRRKSKKAVKTADDQYNDVLNNQSDLFIARAVTWSSQSLVAARTNQLCLGGSAWTSLVHADERVKAAFALWGNSILGMITYWSSGYGVQVDARSRMQIKQIKNVKCPDFSRLEKNVLDKALEDYKRISEMELQPCRVVESDETRNLINESVGKMFGIPVDYMHMLAKHWCVEPSVTKRNMKIPTKETKSKFIVEKSTKTKIKKSKSPKIKKSRKCNKTNQNDK